MAGLQRQPDHFNSFEQHGQHNALGMMVADYQRPELTRSNPIHAWIRNGLLHVTGIAVGEALCIYNAAGVFVYQSVATSDEADIPLSAQGVYIVKSGENSIKVVY
jgi:hypothetical protein